MRTVMTVASAAKAKARHQDKTTPEAACCRSPTGQQPLPAALRSPPTREILAELLQLALHAERGVALDRLSQQPPNQVLALALPAATSAAA